jgi:hypothetical protein
MAREYATLHKVNFDEAWTQCAALHPELFVKSKATTLGNCSANGAHRVFHQLVERQADYARKIGELMVAAPQSPNHIKPEFVGQWARQTLANAGEFPPPPVPQVFKGNARHIEALRLGISGDDASVTPEELSAAMLAAAPDLASGIEPDHEAVFRALADHHMKLSGVDRATAQQIVRGRHPALMSAASAHTLQSGPDADGYLGNSRALANDGIAPAACLPRSFSNDDARALGLSNAADQVLCYTAFVGNGGSCDASLASVNKLQILSAVAAYFVGKFGVPMDAGRTMAVTANPNLA